jgi:hypothetical protein
MDLDTPGCLIFLLDQSGSMADPFGTDRRSKAAVATRATNAALEGLIDNCMKGDTVMSFFHIGVIGYGKYGAHDLLTSGSGPAGLLTSSEVERSTQLEEVETEEINGAGKLEKQIMEKWFSPKARGRTPMHVAFNLASARLQTWVASFPNSFPPILVNITDGEPDLPDVAESAARGLQQIKTNDGDTLLFNCLISGTGAAAIEYPASDLVLSDDKARWLFHISSEIPRRMVRTAQAAGLSTVVPGSRGFVCGATPSKLVKFLRIGSVLPWDVLV